MLVSSLIFLRLKVVFLDSQFVLKYVVCIIRQPYMKPAVEKLDESNKGHQMLRKMGWGGAGLGAKEQGIEQPISGGEVRTFD